MSLSSSKLDDILNELYQIREDMQYALNYNQFGEVIERYRNSFRYKREDTRIRIKGIIIRYEYENLDKDDTRFIRYNKLFPTLYPDFYGLNLILNTYKRIEVIIEEDGKRKRYIIERSSRRTDPFLENLWIRSKLPEAAFLKSDNNINKKLTEARPYIRKDILYKYFSKKRDIYIAVPTTLFTKIMYIFEEFSHILYTSKPYTQEYPYIARLYYGTSDIIKRYINIDLKYLTTLILSKLVDQTGISFIFKGKSENIDYSDLDKYYFYKENIITRLSELEERLEYVIDKIFEFLATYGFLPTDIGFEQIGFSNDKLRFIDIGSGFDVVSKIGIYVLLTDLLVDLKESFEESPYIKICKVNNLSREVICRDGMYSNKESRDTLIGILNKALNRNNIKLIIKKNLNEDNIRSIQEIVRKALEIYSIVYKVTKKV